MKPNDKPENEAENKRALKAKENLQEGNFQNTPDEGEEDVPHEDKIARDSKTGEETFIKNDNKR